jgi:D-xylonolactonase
VVTKGNSYVLNMDVVVDAACEIAENPLWHPNQRALYWTDVPRGEIHRYDPASDTHERIYEGHIVGGFTLQENGELLLFMNKGRIVGWTPDSRRVLVERVPAEEDSRFNDVAADPAGRVFCGTMPTADSLGTLYRLGTDGELTALLSGINVSNGIGFSPSLETMFYTESRESQILSFDYDCTSGDISGRRQFLDWSSNQGVPDGLAVDAEGYVWSAIWNGGCIVRITPDGTVDERIPTPVPRPSSLTFGGPDGSTIYITSALSNGTTAVEQPEGAIYKFDASVVGGPWFRSDIE